MEEPSGQPKFGGTLRWVPQGSIKTIDNVFGVNIIAIAIALHLYDAPLTRDSVGEIRNQALESWSWESKDGGAQFVMTLRDGLKFHDGTALEPDDVIASIDRWKEKARIATFWRDSLQGMEATDNKTVVMTFDSANGAFVSDLASFKGPMAQISPKGIADKYTAFESISKEDTIGSGPYRLASWDPGNELVLDKFEDYAARDEPPSFWAGGKIAYLDVLQAVEIPEVETRMAAVLTGEVDFVDQVPLDFYDRLESSGTSKPILGAGPQPVAFFHLKNPPFDQTESGKLLRQAVFVGANPKEVMQGYGPEQLWKVCSYWWGCDTPGANPELYQQHPQNDIERAKALMKEAGYDGEPITLVDPADFATIHPIAVVMKAQLERMGFNVDYQVTDWATEIEYQNEGPDKRSWHIMTTWGFMNLDPLTHFFLVDQGNVSHSEFPVIQELKGQLAEASSEVEQKKLMDDMAAVLYDEVPFMTFGQFRTVYGANRDLEGFIVSDFNNAPYFIGTYWNR
jgi:peptide/nickel transport system substrate-binding protein